MFERESIPFAPALVESMRSLGYSFKTAIADLIDNSISADAKYIDIIMSISSKPVIVILDDGHGMNCKDLEEAMRYGSKNPLEKRNEGDLGRFGLGLKSASLSQCRSLTVVSKKSGEMSSFAWKLDHIIKTGSWALIGYDDDELNELPQFFRLKKYEHGTYILLEDFDRIEVSTNDVNNTLTKYLDQTIDHLALVFHRFLNEGLKIRVNNTEVEPRDPFLTKHKSTQIKREQSFTINDSKIIVKPYILPHVSKLSLDDLKIVGGKDALKNEQGFYIYRNKRLIIWGTWFRLERKDELSKLARIMVDIPNSLDYMWSIDIKKSTANLPDIIKKNLYNCVYESVLNSEIVHNYRGRSTNEFSNIDYIWERISMRDGYQYKINRNIPQFKLLKRSLEANQYKEVENLIKLIELSFPSSTLYLDVSKGNLIEEEDVDTQNLYQQVMAQIETAKNLGMDINSLIAAFIKTEPYCMNDLLIKMLEKELKENECNAETVL